MLDIKNRETLEIYVLGDDFKFYQNLKYLPLTSYPSNNQSALIIYCLGGKAKITVHEDVHWIQPEELIILLPGQFVSFSEPSEDFSTVTMVISTSLFSDALSGVPRFLRISFSTCGLITGIRSQNEIFPGYIIIWV